MYKTVYFAYAPINSLIPSIIKIITQSLFIRNRSECGEKGITSFFYAVQIIFAAPLKTKYLH